MEMFRRIHCNPYRSSMNGMTLIEVLIVVAIIGIIAGIAYPSYGEHVKAAHRKQAIADIVKIQLQLEQDYSSGYVSTTVATNTGACKSTFCETDTDRYAITVTIPSSSDSYTIAAVPQSASGQDTDKCDSSTYTKLELDETGNGTPSACWE